MNNTNNNSSSSSTTSGTSNPKGVMTSSEPINTTTPTTNRIVSFLGKSKNNFNPTKASSKHHKEAPLTRLQKIVMNFGRMWNDSFGRRVISFAGLFIASAYFVAIPKFNRYVKEKQDEDDEEEEEEEE